MTDKLRFDERVVVITGAGRGLGRAYALSLARLGARVVVNDIGGSIRGDEVTADAASDVVAEIHAMGGKAIANTDSVTTLGGSKGIIDAAINEWGRIDALIHNAGNVRYGTIAEISQEDYQAVLDVHLAGAFNTVKAAFPYMLAANYGRIVLTSSIGGIYGNKACVNYAIAKSAMIGLANVAALEGEEHNIKANVIVPSAVTRMAEGLDISQYPPMEPEKVAPAVAWLAHERCSLTGEMLAAIAGRIARVFIAETKGVWHDTWSIDDVDTAMARICDTSAIRDFGLHGHADHIQYSFAMARQGVPQSGNDS